MTEVASRVDDDERWAGFPRGASSMTARDNARLFLLPPDDDKARAVTTSGVASMEMGRPGGVVHRIQLSNCSLVPYMIN